MEGLLDPTFKEVRIGAAEVREVFKVPKIGAIAGCMVTDGRITRAGETTGAPAARQRRGARRQDRLAAPLQGRRQRGEVGLRVRHRPRAVQRHQGRRHHRSVHDGAGQDGHRRRLMHGVNGSGPSRSRRRTDPRGAERDAHPRRGARPGHRLHHADARAGHARPADRARLLHHLGDPKARKETARALDARHAVLPPPDRRPAAACAACPSSSSGSTSRSRTRTASSRSCGTSTRRTRSARRSPTTADCRASRPRDDDDDDD